MLCMLLEFVEESQKAAFSRFFLRYERALYAVALHMLGNPHRAEDCVHDSALKLISHFEEISQFSCQEIEGYIVTIVKNTAIDMLRDGRRLTGLPQDWDAPAPGDGPESVAGYRHLVERILAMPETYRGVLELVLVEERSVKDAAELLGLKENTAAVRLSRGRKLLKEQLQKEGYGYD